jgi:ankyrin repeat protein
MVAPPEVIEAASTGDLTTVREWLESGGDPNDTNSSGRITLLMKVVTGQEASAAHVDMLRLLLSHGADVNLVPNANRSAPYIIVPFSQRTAGAGPCCRFSLTLARM